MKKYYLCFVVNRLPDLTLTKYSVYDGSSVDNIIEKHGIFLRQLHRLGKTSQVYFHLLYYYNPSQEIQKGQHLTIMFYATADEPSKLEGIREFLTTSVLSTYYDFNCFDISSNFSISEKVLSNGDTQKLLTLTTLSGEQKEYGLGRIDAEKFAEAKEAIESGKENHITCEVASDADVILSLNQMPVDDSGRVISPKRFAYGAFLTKREYILTAQNRSSMDAIEGAQLYSLLEWEPNESGRLYNVLKLMEGYDSYAALRIDLFPVDETIKVRNSLPYSETRNRIADRGQGKDDNSENIIKSWDKYLGNIVKFPQFYANVVAFADSQDQAIMLADSVAAEAVESGTYLVESISDVINEDGMKVGAPLGDAPMFFNSEPTFGGGNKAFGINENNTSQGDIPGQYDFYFMDTEVMRVQKERENYVAEFLSLYTLEELRPMFSFPILYPGENIERNKETDPVPFDNVVTIDSTGTTHEVMSLGASTMGYDVTFPLELFKKHAFIAGVPGAGKTNTMLYLVTTLWRDTRQHIPFLVLEPAKQEYRALTQIEGMEDLLVFSPGADTYFPLHINPFEFPEGLTLAEHIANLNAVFAGAFELPPPSPHFIDTCIEKVYVEKGWNVNERNDGKREYPTLQELYNSLEVAVKESHYQGETLGNLQSVLEVRIGSLLKREIGNVYNVRRSIIPPEEWLNRPIIIELESLGEGPANFMSLLISTLIREVLKIRKVNGVKIDPKTAQVGDKKEIQHIIFYEEAHNLIGPITESPDGMSVNPKISATKYLVKMLAEVRALGEGIVIADQLPTVMAPEVLKNTGLKIGHRITAQDDRGLLGSTMSASADQLEEQGTFLTGEALIFYEGLLKPFKMRMHEWEKGVSKSKYDSPSNEQMYERMKDYPVYKSQIEKSNLIIQEKMESEFDVLRKKAQKQVELLLEDVDFLQLRKGQIENLERAIRLATDDEKKQKKEKDKKVLEDGPNGIVQKRKIIETVRAADIIRICREYNNLFEAYMTLSQNYGEYADDIRICTINNYLSLYRILSKAAHVRPIAEAVIRTNKQTLNNLKKYVNYKELDQNGQLIYAGGSLLSSHKDYYNILADAQNILLFEIEGMLADILSEIPEKPEVDHIVPTCDRLANIFMTYTNIANAFLQLDAMLEADVQGKIEAKAYNNLEEERSLKNKLQVINDSKYMTHYALSYVVAEFFEELRDIEPVLRRHLVFRMFTITEYIRNSLINYYTKEKAGYLSPYSRYSELREKLEAITWAEIQNNMYKINLIWNEKVSPNIKELKGRLNEAAVQELKVILDEIETESDGSTYENVRASHQPLLVDFVLNLRLYNGYINNLVLDMLGQNKVEVSDKHFYVQLIGWFLKGIENLLLQGSIGIEIVKRRKELKVPVILGEVYKQKNLFDELTPHERDRWAEMHAKYINIVSEKKKPE